jgi:starch synthase (maltosyl-transferring)
MTFDGRRRVVIEHVEPEIECGEFPIKRTPDETVSVEADIFADGHDTVNAILLYRHEQDKQWQEVPLVPMGNDRWQAEFKVSMIGIYRYTLEAWIDHFKTWRENLQKKYFVGQDIAVELQIGMEYIHGAAKNAGKNIAVILSEWANRLSQEADQSEAFDLVMNKELTQLMQQYGDKSFASRYDKELLVRVDRQRALFSAWYELFPRSASSKPGQHGTFKDVENLLPEISEMGFDIIYFPPIHPIGTTARKGKNNAIKAKKNDPGSPWAIGSREGGHKAIHPQLGTVDDFRHLVDKAREYDMEIALDLAYQCSQDHPYVKEHPQWFRWRPDGTVQYAENPPKKYQDVLAINFENEDWKALWEELKSVVTYWIDKGVFVFRVDNPHTKPLAFWRWLINEIKSEYPDVIFLAEAFTRPKVMYRLAKVGFTQSYTYFTWRNTKHEFIDYLSELTLTEPKNYFRPNFWPNTPDILPEHLQFGGPQAFIIRLLLATTLSSNYGIYGPVFESQLSEAVSDKDEYIDSEKYEIHHWDRSQSNPLKSLIQRMNRIRRNVKALQHTNNIRFIPCNNEQILAFLKLDPEKIEHVLVVINLDVHHDHNGFIDLPLDMLDIKVDESFRAHDHLSEMTFIWQGSHNYIELRHDPYPAHVLSISPRLHKEQDFDYYM